ncbi:uncharacterized protein LOC142151994 isoform X2 [Mixophyes fleayi]|uniref:uncharacterized protein LOC142151994 isoform X2 n=1 Tax=Mixophyes fleayi TaxID=3061075 RepID=UPI003F4D7594
MVGVWMAFDVAGPSLPSYIKEYTIVKKSSPQCSSHSTEEVPVKYDDVAVYFSKEEWEYLQAHKELYQDVITMNRQTQNTFNILVNQSSDAMTYLDSKNSIPSMVLLTPESRSSIVKKKHLQVPLSVQFTQLMHCITKLGRRMAKIDRNITHILKEFKHKNVTVDPEQQDTQEPENHCYVSNNCTVSESCIEDDLLLDVCQDAIKQPAQTPLLPSSFESLYSPTFTGPVSFSPSRTTVTNIDTHSVNAPSFPNVLDISEQSQVHQDIYRIADFMGEALPDIPLATVSTGLLNNFKMQSRGQPHRFAQLLFQHHVPYKLYKTWIHKANYDGSRGKHALPNNLKRVIINETSVAYQLTPAVLKKIKDTLNGLLRIPRTGGWGSNYYQF